MPFCADHLLCTLSEHTRKPDYNKDVPQTIRPDTRIKKRRKRVSPCARPRGSYTLEAAVIVPLTALFFAALLFFFRVLQIQTQVQYALDYASRKTACEAAALSSETGLLASAEGYFRKSLGDYTLPAKYIRGGGNAVTLLRSDLSGNYVVLRADYYVKLPIAFFSVKGIAISQGSKSHKWTGDRDDGETEDYVYITAHGTVYHTSRSCRYLDLSIRTADAGQIDSLRNKSGGKYYACGSCARSHTAGTVYVTDYGTNYHTSLSCSGLKRTIYLVPLSQAGEKSPCSKCGAHGG